MKQFIPPALSLLLLCSPTPPASARPDGDFSLVRIDRRVSDFPDHPDLSEPLKAFLTIQYVKAAGKQDRLRPVHSYRIRAYFPSPGTPDLQMTEEQRDGLLNTEILGVARYRDSVAAVLTVYRPSLCLITYMSKEDGEWLAAGEDLGKDLDDACAIFEKKAPNFAGYIERIARLKKVTADREALRTFILDHGRSPKTFLLDALGRHALVIYGEIHRRKSSWDLLKEVVADPAFPRRTGTIFMEVSADAQSALDDFFEKDTADPALLLDIFRNIQINGWYDRGMYEFLIEARAVNRRLAPQDRFRVVAVDEPRPFASFAGREDMERHFAALPDRNTIMARTIRRVLEATRNRRNGLFIVGLAHAYKSAVPGIAGGKPENPAPTAAAQLSTLLPPGSVFSIIQHAPIIGNDGTCHGPIRNGLLDAVFEPSGDGPVAFLLGPSPLADEPFDAIPEIGFSAQAGTFADNFDAYLFLGPLSEERGEYLLTDIVTEEFVVELRRRARLAGTTVEKWFGVGKATKEAIVEKLRLESEKRRRWPEAALAGRVGAAPPEKSG